MRVFRIIICLLLCSICIGCSNKEISKKFIDVENQKVYYTLNKYGMESVAAVFEDGKVLIEDGTDGLTKFRIYDVEKDNEIIVGDGKPWSVSSGSNILVDDTFYTSQLCIDENFNETLRMIKVDSNGKFEVIKEIEKTEDLSPFIYFSGRDETSFFLTYRQNKQTKIIIYNFIENTFQEFADPSGNENSNRSLEKICVYGKNIYLVVYENEEYFLELYDANLNLIIKMNLDIPLLKENDILWFWVVRDYLIFSNWNCDQSVYRLQKNELKWIMDCRQNMYIFSHGYSGIYNDYNGKYFYYTKDENGELFAFDLENEKTLCKKIKYKGKDVAVCGALVNKNGDMIASLEVVKDSEKLNTYIFKNETLNDLFGN